MCICSHHDISMQHERGYEALDQPKKMVSLDPRSILNVAIGYLSNISSPFEVPYCTTAYAAHVVYTHGFPT